MATKIFYLKIPNNIYLWLLLLLLVVSASPVVRGQQRIVEEPEDTVAKLGETVILKCRTQNQKGQVIWMKGDIGLGYNRELPFWERMSMVGSSMDGEHHLEIRNVSLADEDTYQCQLSSTDEEPQARLSRQARLTIIVEPNGPVLLGESVAPLQRNQRIASTEGHPVRLSCQSRGGKPPAQIHWAIAEDWLAQKMIGRILNGTEEMDQRHPGGVHPMRVREHLSSHAPWHSRSHNLSGNITETEEMDESNRLHTITSHLTFSPTKEENGRWLVCLASHQAYGRESRTATVEMDLFYAPKVRVEVDTAQSQLHEGGHVRLRCLSDGRPNEDLKFSWKWDGEPKRLELIDSQNALINGLRFNDNAKRVQCTVENAIGAGSGVLELDVPYGPRFMSTNQTKTVDRGTEVTFQCEALGNPQPIVRWYHGRDWDTPVFEGKNLTILNTQDWEEGEYRCTAEVDGFPPRTLYHMLYLKGPPKVRLSEYIVMDGGSTVTLICEIQSRAMPLRVHWFHNGHRVDIDHSSSAGNADGHLAQMGRRRYHVQDEKVGRHELISRLTINGFGQEDFGKWNCSAKNDYGLVWDQKEIEVIGVIQRLARYAKGMPMEWKAALFAALLLALLLPCMAICLCRKYCCCCCRAKGHSKLSNHSSEPRGEISGVPIGDEPILVHFGGGEVKCEDLDGLTNNSSATPPYPQQFYIGSAAGDLASHHHQQPLLNGGGDGLMGPMVNEYLCHQYSNSLIGQQQQQQNGSDLIDSQGMLYSAAGGGGGGVYSQSAGHPILPPQSNEGLQQFNEYFGAAHQQFPNGGGAGGTFGPNSGSSFFASNHSNGSPQMMNNPYDLGPMNDSYGRQQQQQFYGYPMGIGGAGGPSPLEPVTEVCTPESQTDGYGGGGVPLAGAEPERTISRISTHV